MRGLVAIVALVALVALITLPVLAADPSPSATASAAASPSAEPSASVPAPSASPSASAPTVAPAPAATEVPKASKSPKPEKSSQGQKAAKTPTVDVRLLGVVKRTTNDKGRAAYTMTVNGTTYELEAGPPWFFGDNHPLEPYVDKTVTVEGDQHEGSPEVDVATVNGKLIRESGRPPWAGGWKHVGKVHPGWSQEKWDRWQAKLEAKGVACWPPGLCKDKPAKPDDEGPN